MKKYFKYILLTFILLLGFNLDVKAAPEKISMSVSEVKSNLCEYKYDGLTIKLSGLSDNGMGVDVTGDLKNYSGYNTEFIEENTINQRTCPNLKVYLLQGDVLYFSTSENFSNITDMVYKDRISGTLKRITTACVYKTEDLIFQVTYNPVNNKLNFKSDYAKEYANEQTGLSNAAAHTLQITSAVKKGWKYGESGLICQKDFVIMDICADYWVRTKTDKMASTCTKSTNPAGFVEVIGKDDKYNGEIKYLSDICDVNTTVVTIMRAVGYALVIVKILVPLLLIAMGIISFSKVVINGDEGETKKAASGLLIKFIAAVVIFVLPTIINFIFETIDGATDGTEDYENCRICIFEPGDCDIP